MIKLENKTKIATIALTLVLISSAFLVLSNSTSTTADASNADYGDLLQYEWPGEHGDISLGWHTAGGPAPATMDVLWQVNDLGNPWSAFDGKVFTDKGYALDPFTGEIIYQTEGTNPTKLDDTYFVSGNSVYETATGLRAYGPYSVNIARLPMSSAYNSDLKMFWTRDSGSPIGVGNMLYGWDWPDISQEPTLAWATFISKGIGAAGSHVYADGKIFTGNHEGTAMCLDGKTGNMLWETPVEGYIAYYGSYYDDRWVASCGEGIIYCFNATTGEILWEFDPGIFYSFWGETGAIYDGVIYPVSNNYHTYAIDIYTGELLWDFKSTQGAGYQTHTVAAGGYVYAMTGRAGYLDPDTGMPFKDEYVCLDAKTGEVLWKTNRVIGGSGGGPPAVRNIIAYGNLYLAVDQAPIPGSWLSSANLLCIGPPQPWPSFQNDAANTGNSQRGGPENLSLKWTFNGDAAFTTDPVASDGKIYIGSLNGTFYCLDYLTGDPIWTFETPPTANRIIDWDMSLQTPEGFTTDVTAAGLISTIKSTAALDNAGRVFFVSDGDGYIYCLDAANGNLNWKTFIGANATLVYQTQVRYASSPKVVDGKLYVGSKNGIFYCLNTANGNSIWTFDTQNRQLSSTPAISDGAVYVTVGGTNNRTYSESTITTGDNGTLYKFDANSGSKIWETGVPFYIARSMRHFQGSPVVGDGIVFQSSNNWATYAFNASTGEQMWCFAADFGGSLPNTVTPAYANGRVYVHEYFSIACLNATTGEKIWSTWLAREQLGGPIYADGRIYVASELKVFWVLDALTGEKLDFYAWDDFCWSNPCVYAGNLYWGTAGKKVFCFEQAPYGETIYYGTSTGVASEMAPNLIEPGAEPGVATETSLISTETGAEPGVATETSLISTEIAIIAAVVVVAALVVYTLYTVRKQRK